MEGKVNLFSLQGRVALVTGAGRGIGHGVAKGLAAHGARCVCAARTRSQLDETVAAIEAAGGDALAVEMDMADLDSVKRGVETTCAHYGQLDILVNNAGMNIREPLDAVTEEHYDRIMAVNLKGLYFLTQLAAKLMMPRKQGKVINIGSLTTGIAAARRVGLYRHQGGRGSADEGAGARTGTPQYPGECDLPRIYSDASDGKTLVRPGDAGMGRRPDPRRAAGHPGRPCGNRRVSGVRRFGLRNGPAHLRGRRIHGGRDVAAAPEGECSVPKKGCLNSAAESPVSQGA